MKEKSIRKLTIAGLLVAVAVVGSLFSIPVLGAKCSPVQHMVNVLGAVLLGPWYAVGMAFAASLIRNLLGLGSLLAFPGSMIGALLCGLLYKLCPKLPVAYVGEVFGTGVLGGIASYPIAVVLMNNKPRRCSPLSRLFWSRLRSALPYRSLYWRHSSARRFLASWRERCGDRKYKTDHIVCAAGSSDGAFDYQ